MEKIFKEALSLHQITELSRKKITIRDLFVSDEHSKFIGEFKCRKCRLIAVQPQECIQCSSIYCQDCIERKKQTKPPQCIFCKREFQKNPPREKYMKILSKIQFKCKFNCPIPVTMDTIERHYTLECPNLKQEFCCPFAYLGCKIEGTNQFIVWHFSCCQKFPFICQICFEMVKQQNIRSHACSAQIKKTGDRMKLTKPVEYFKLLNTSVNLFKRMQIWFENSNYPFDTDDLFNFINEEFDNLISVGSNKSRRESFVFDHSKYWVYKFIYQERAVELVFQKVVNPSRMICYKSQLFHQVQ